MSRGYNTLAGIILIIGNNTMAEIEYITTEESSRLTGYDPQHIRRLLRSGKVKGQKFGRTWMIDKQSLLAYLQGEGRGPKSSGKN